MERFLQLFGTMIAFTYHCFDRIVIRGYLSMLSRPEHIVYFFRDVLGIRCITKEVLAKRTTDYQNWVESYARNHCIPIEWAEKDVRKEDRVRPFLRSAKRTQSFGVYFMFKSMEQATTFRSVKPKFKTNDPDYRILKKTRSRFTHYYFYIFDDALGAMVLRVGSFLPFQTTWYLNGHNFIEREFLRQGIPYRMNDNAFVSVFDPRSLQRAADRFTPECIRQRIEYWTFLLGPKFSKKECSRMGLHRYYFISQIEWCSNLIFRRHFPIDRLFKRSCELALASITADTISQFFGSRLTRCLHGKLHTTLDRIEQGHHVFRAYCKHAFVKQYEKLRTFLRIETCSNNLSDFHLKKSLERLPEVKKALHAVNDRFARFQASMFNVHVDFPLFQRLALPITSGAARIPGIKIQDTRMVRLMEVLLHAAGQIRGFSTAALHERILRAYRLSANDYSITQLRYDLRKVKARGLITRNGHHYTYRLTDKGIKVSLLFVLFHKRVCGPLANSLFHHKPTTAPCSINKLEKAYHKADA
ncbi:MAG: hypothetical protein WCO26_23175, partial [Deltaproteobacteria bacterium]